MENKHFTNPESKMGEDNSPVMRFNNLILELRRLPEGDTVDLAEKTELKRQLLEVTKELPSRDQEEALAAVEKYFAASLVDPADLNEKYSV